MALKSDKYSKNIIPGYTGPTYPAGFGGGSVKDTTTPTPAPPVPSKIVVPPGGTYVGYGSGGGVGGTYTTPTGEVYHGAAPSMPAAIKTGTGQPTSPAMTTILSGISTPAMRTPDDRARAISAALETTFKGEPGTAVIQPSGRAMYGGMEAPPTRVQYFQDGQKISDTQRILMGAGMWVRPEEAMKTLQTKYEQFTGLGALPEKTPQVLDIIKGLTPEAKLYEEAKEKETAMKTGVGLVGARETVEAQRQKVAELTGQEYRPLERETLQVGGAAIAVPVLRGLPMELTPLEAFKEERAIQKVPTTLTTVDINQLTKRIVDFNVKAELYKSVPYFARDLKQEEALNIERNKLTAVLGKNIPGIDISGVLSSVEKTGLYTGIQGKTTSEDVMAFLRGKAFLKGEQDLIKIGEGLGPGKEVDKNTWQGFMTFKQQTEAFNKLIDTGKATPEQIEWMKAQIPASGKIYLEGTTKFTPEVEPLTVKLPEGEKTIGIVTAPSEQVLKEYKEIKPTFMPWGITRKATQKEEKDIVNDYEKLTAVNLGKAFEKKQWTDKELAFMNTVADDVTNINKKYIERQEEILGTQQLAALMGTKVKDLKLSMADSNTIKTYQDAYDLLNQKATTNPVLGIQDKIDALAVEMDKNYKLYITNPTQENYDKTITPIVNEIKNLETTRDTKIATLSVFEPELQAKTQQLVQLKGEIDKGNKDINFYNDKNRQLYEITSQKISNLSKQNAWVNLIQEGRENPEWQARAKGLGASVAQIAAISPITSVMDIGRQYGKQVEQYLKGGEYVSPELLKALPVTGIPYALGQTSLSGERAGIFNLKSYDIEQMMGTAIAGTYPISALSGYLGGLKGTAAIGAEPLTTGQQFMKLLAPTAIKGTIIGGLVSAPPVITAVSKALIPGAEKMTKQEFQQDVAGNLLGFMAIDLANRAIYKTGYEAGELKVNKNVLKNVQVELSEKLKGMVQDIEGKKVGTIASELTSKPIKLPNGAEVTIKGTGITENVAGQTVREFNGLKYALSESGTWKQLPSDYKGLMGTESTVWLDAQIKMPNGKIVPYKLGYFDYGGQGVYKVLTDSDVELLRQGQIVFTPEKGKGWFTLQTSKTGITTKGYEFPKGLLTRTQLETEAITGQPVRIGARMQGMKLGEISTELYKPEGGELVPRGAKEFEYVPTAEEKINNLIGMGVGKGKVSTTKTEIFGTKPSPERPVTLTASQVKSEAQRLLQLEPGYTQQQLQKLYGVVPEEMFRGLGTTKITTGTAGTGTLRLDKLGIPYIEIKGNLGALLGTEIYMPGTWRITPEDLKGAWTGIPGAIGLPLVSKPTMPSTFGGTANKFDTDLQYLFDTDLQYLLQTTPTTGMAQMIGLERLAPLTTFGPSTYALPKILTGLYAAETEVAAPARASAAELMVTKMMGVPKLDVQMSQILAPPEVRAEVVVPPEVTPRVGITTTEVPITELLTPEIITTPTTVVPSPIPPMLVTPFILPPIPGGGLPTGGDYYRKMMGVKEWTVAWPIRDLPSEFFYQQKLKDYMARTARPTGRQYAQGSVDRMFGKIKGLDTKRIKNIMGRGAGGMI